MSARVLVVEDDESVREAVSIVLERAGFEVDTESDGAEAVRTALADSFDLILLDIMLPSLNGLDVCRQIRSRSGVPIVMLSARTDTADVVTGLELGADDYVTKPFKPSELAARARAAVRRATPVTSLPERARDLHIDQAAFRVARADAQIPLTAIEFRLLVSLVSHSGQVVRREELLEEVWGYDYLGDSRLVDMAVRRLRVKLGEPPAPPPYITTVRSVGYRFEDG